MRKAFIIALAAAALLPSTGSAQEAVVGVANPDALFHDRDPVLNRNKQAAYHIVKELLECSEWNRAGEWLTDRYIQHNPLAASGLKGVVYYFTQVRKAEPKPCPGKMQTKIVSVVAAGDLVIVAYPREFKEPKDPSKTYTTTWFDMWRFVDGKADEHWDGATKS